MWNSCAPGSRVEAAVPSVMAGSAFMEVQSAFGSGAPPNLNMDTTFTQRQGRNLQTHEAGQETATTTNRLFWLGTDLGISGQGPNVTGRFSNDDRWQKEVIQTFGIKTKYIF